MCRVLPVLFNTDMVQAILDGRKTVTRRIVHRGKSCPQYHGRDKFHKVVDHLNNDYKNWYAEFYNDDDVFEESDGEKRIDGIYFKLPYKSGEVLYVRETWMLEEFYDDEALIRFRAGGKKELSYEKGGEFHQKLYKFADDKWNPSLFMPKEAARIWLKVTDVRVERLSRMLELDFQKEGISLYKDDMTEKTEIEMEYEFQDLWNSTIKKSELMLYGWDADPWVFVYEFERCEKTK